MLVAVAPFRFGSIPALDLGAWVLPGIAVRAAESGGERVVVVWAFSTRWRRASAS